MSDDVYEIYAVQYARHERPASQNFLGGDPHDGPMPLNFYVWLLVGAGRTIVVDTGYDQASADRRGRSILKPVGEGLKAMGVDHEKIEDVIVTHLHFDHAGNSDLFPNARYHLQDSEMAYATGRCMCHALPRTPFDVEDVCAMVRRVYADRVVFHDGEDQIAPGVTVHHVGGHSRGLQVVRVKTRRGWVVVASDASHHYAHMEQGRVFPIVDRVQDTLEGYRTCARLATSRDHIIPGHDPLVSEIYPAARPGMEGWAVRLDADPKPR